MNVEPFAKKAFLSLPLWLWIFFSIIIVVLILMNVTCFIIMRKSKASNPELAWWDDNRPLPSVPAGEEPFQDIEIGEPKPISSPPIGIPRRNSSKQGNETSNNGMKNYVTPTVYSRP